MMKRFPIKILQKTDRSPYAARCLGVALSLAIGFSASQARALTLKEAVEETLRTNPEIQAAWKNLRAMERTERQAYSAYFPVVDLTAVYGPEVTDNAATRLLPGRSENHDLTMTKGEVGITVTQSLFDGFQTKHQVEKAKANTESAGYLFDNTAETVVSGAVQTYLDHLKLQKILELVKDNVLLHQRTLKKLEQKAQAGGGGKEDVEQTMGKLALASAGHASSQVALKNNEVHFLQVVGVPARNLIRPTPPFQYLPKTLDDAIAQAIQYHPLILTSQAELIGNKSEISGAKGLFLPGIGLGLAYTNTADSAGTPGHSKSASALLTMQYNLFRGGNDSSRGQELNERLKQRQSILDQTMRGVREGVEVAWNGLQTARKRMTQLTKHVSLLRKAAATNQEQFNIGKKTMLDVLGVENERFGAEVGYTTEDWTAAKAVYQLLASMGRLRQAMEMGQDNDPTKPALQNADLIIPQERFQDTEVPSRDPPASLPEPLVAAQESPPETETLEPPGDNPIEAPAKLPEELSSVAPAELAAESPADHIPSALEPMESPDVADTYTNPADMAASAQQQRQKESPLEAPQREALPWTQSDSASRFLRSSGSGLENLGGDGHFKTTLSHSDQTERSRAGFPLNTILPWQQKNVPRLIVTGQYALTESSILFFTQLVRVSDNRVLSSVTEEIPLTWRLQKILGLPTSTLKAIGHGE